MKYTYFCLGFGMQIQFDSEKIVANSYSLLTLLNMHSKTKVEMTIT